MARTVARCLRAGMVFVLLLVGLQVGSATRGTASAAPPTPTPNPEKVTVGFYVQNIQRVDLATNSFSADFYIWLRWNNPDLDAPAGLEIMNVFESWALTETDLYEEPRKQPDGSLVWLTRYQGQFNTPLSVSDYPFQKQTLRLVIEDAIEDSEQVVYVPDTDPITINPEITLAGYNFGKPRIVADTHTYPTSFGDIESSEASRTYTRVTVEIPVTAPAASGISKTILPLLIVLLAAALGVIIPASYVDSKVNVPITALIALVAMQFGVSSALPEVGYLPMIDLIYVLAHAAITGMLASAVIGAWELRRKGEDEAMALERRFTLWICIGFVAAFTAVLLFYLLPAGTH
ncbi:MAG: hypothetical protein FGM52_04760 [Mycobacterium sp.]|nr:hypothetical protein [Mycobacterium sp.]